MTNRSDLIRSIMNEISSHTDLIECKSFSELHDYCDANMLGESEKYSNLNSIGILDSAQCYIDRYLELKAAVKYYSYDYVGFHGNALLTEARKALKKHSDYLIYRK
jgi:hypothetical protein